MTRPSVTAIEERPYAQVLIIGGGVNGVGTFRDLALQGVDVILVERADYAQGASGASSHMIHGGIRYLENGEFRLVKESVEERNGLLKTAPQFVKPLQTTIPIVSKMSGFFNAPLKFLSGGRYKSKNQERGAYLIKTGLMGYDSFSRGGGMVPRHEFADKENSHAILPELNDKFNYTATYYDGSIYSPERLIMDLLYDGKVAGEHGDTPSESRARASNYLQAIAQSSQGVVVQDVLGQSEFTIHADVVLNMTGAWSDLTNKALGQDTSFMGGTRGSHIVLNSPELLEATQGREIFFENEEDGRIVLIYPMGDRILVGTTDLEADISQDSIIEDHEIDYFFKMVKQIFPRIKIDKNNIVYTFSGVRPLPHHDDQSPGAVSRDYRIEKTEVVTKDSKGREVAVPRLTLVGGKLTTFRALSEHVTNDTLKILGQKRKISTVNLPIGGGRNYPATEWGQKQWISEHSNNKISPEEVSVIFDRYGTRGSEVITFIEQEEDTPLKSTSELSPRQIKYMIENEDLVRLIDIFIRRTSLAFRGIITPEILKETSDLMGQELGWNHTEKTRQIEEAQEELAKYHRVKNGHFIDDDTKK